MVIVVTMRSWTRRCNGLALVQGLRRYAFPRLLGEDWTNASEAEATGASCGLILE
jgi:hypothetical protein